MAKNSSLKQIISKLHSFSLLILPTSLILTLIDFRFHNYFWPKLDQYRLLSPSAFFDFSSLFSYFLIIFIIISLLQFFLNEDRTKKVFNDSFSIFLIITLGTLLLFSILLSFNNYQPLEPVIKSFKFQVLTNYIQPFLLFFFLFLTASSNNKFRLLRLSFIFTFSAFGLLVIFQSFSGKLPGATHDFLGRSVWPYIDPFIGMKAESANWLTYLFGPLTMLSLIDFNKAKNILLKILFSLSFLIFISVIFLTQSYTSLLVLFFLIGLFWFIKLPKKIKIISLLGSVLVLTLLVFSQKDSPKFQILFGSADYSKPNSIIRRLQIYELNGFAMEENLIKGLGAGNYQNYFLKNQKNILEEPIPTEEVPPHPHNLAVNFWSDLGIFGLILILIVYLWTAINLLQKDQNLYFFALAYPLLHGLIDTPYTLEENSLLFWILIYFALPKTKKLITQDK